VLLDGEALAREVANQRAMNIVVLGAASPHLGIDAADIEKAIQFVFARKGEQIVEANLRAFRAGREFAESKAATH
jgi:indolepyruvate ferredoxin oxidoreductase beta subunit